MNFIINMVEQVDLTDIRNILSKAGQTHILERLVSNNKSNKQLKDQIQHLEKIYPGGVLEYVNRAIKLLEDSKNGVNPYEGYTPSIPTGIDMIIGSNEFHNYEKNGIEKMAEVGFVLVAGGLGERLGYPGIKISIPIEFQTNTSYIEFYINHIKAFQKHARKFTNQEINIPLCIMTSDDTHSQTQELLSKNNNYGLEEITIVKQEKVPALLNNYGHIAFTENSDGIVLETKPHGHGDVHTLLYQHDVINSWKKKGKKYVIFFQDTNSLAFKAIPSLLGCTYKQNFVVNTMSIKRKPGDALGALCKLTKEHKSITINVEYNQLDSLLKSKYNKDGDVANNEGYSDFPGNTNILCIMIEPYSKTLDKTKGLVPEFVNPKYKDELKIEFKSPTRLECMMQDFPLLFTDNEKVGFTTYPTWYSFSSCKNNLEDSIVRLKKGLSPESGFSAEQMIYEFYTNSLELLGKLEITNQDKHKVEILGTNVEFGPKIVISPLYACTLKELDDKINGKIKISSKSSLVLTENSPIINSIEVDGTLIVNGQLEFEKYDKKDYVVYESLNFNEGEVFEKVKGYRIKK